jgi:uncharacterized membrane protein YfcA
LVAALSAFIIGFSKTGVPGTGILMVPMMAIVFGGRLSVGATLPMLIFADIFAVAFYRRSADWRHLQRLAPWVAVGLLIGTTTLRWLGHHRLVHDPLNPAIGGIVLLMLGLSLLRSRIGDRLVPTGPIGMPATGLLAGFTTMVSNAAGPIMQIYLIAADLPKLTLMGTTAWYFLIVNVSKVPLLIGLTLDNPEKPLLNQQTLMLNLALFPVIAAGALAGKALLPKIPQKQFNQTVLVLSAVAAIRLLFS